MDSNYLFAIGVAIAGIGLTLFFQGLAMRDPEHNRRNGNFAYGLGILWMVMGFIPLVVACVLISIK